MYQYDDPTAAIALPTPAAAGTAGYFTDGSPTGGVPATILRADFMNMLQAELLSILTAGDVTPSKTTYNQVLSAIQQFVQAKTMAYASDTGAANACVVSYAPAITALTDGMELWFKAKVANTGATTLNVNGLGAQPVVGAAQSALQGGEIIANGRCQVIWNATLSSWVLTKCTGGALQVTAGAQSSQAVNFGQFTSSLASNGWRKLPNGDIEQWGSFTSSASADVPTNYSISFPNAVYSVVLTTVAGTSAAYLSTITAPATTAGFASGTYNVSTLARVSTLVYYRAIGK